MSALDAPTQQQPAVPAPTVGPAPAGHVHSHRPGPDGDRHPHYRWLLIADPVDQDHNPLPPAVRSSLAPGWWATRPLHAGPDDATGLLRPIDLQHTREDGTP
ncbi:hypothetical protein [Micromonospora echinospora]|uniref:hypothetical protein n=1 Tax=Micromonospora echinospora TaxID=1877 RepID=UPI003A8B1465